MKYSIQTLNKISKAGTDRFCDAYTISDDAKDPDAILVRSASLHDTSFGDNLKAIARAGAGVNNIPLDRCSEAGICVFNTPGANANAVKAMAWAATLKDGETSVAKQVEKGKSQFAGPEIKGKTLGIIGLGAIGALVANAAVALGMKVVGTDPFLSVGAALRLDPSVTVVKTQDDVFAAADYLTIHVPFNKDTEGMINAAAIAKMKDGVRVLNYARGELVNDDDMIAALESGKVGGAGLDVVEEENDLVYFNRAGAALPHRTMNILRSMPNVIVSPHNAFYTDVNVASMVRSGFEELTDFAAGRSNPCEVPL